LVVFLFLGWVEEGVRKENNEKTTIKIIRKHIFHFSVFFFESEVLNFRTDFVYELE